MASAKTYSRFDRMKNRMPTTKELPKCSTIWNVLVIYKWWHNFDVMTFLVYFILIVFQFYFINCNLQLWAKNSIKRNCSNGSYCLLNHFSEYRISPYWTIFLICIQRLMQCYCNSSTKFSLHWYRLSIHERDSE